MTKKERKNLDFLVERIRKTTDLIHTLPIDTGLEDLEGLSAIEIIQAIVQHLNAYDIYLRYIRFDREASVRDLDNLCKIIKQLSRK